MRASAPRAAGRDALGPVSRGAFGRHRDRRRRHDPQLDRSRGHGSKCIGACSARSARARRKRGPRPRRSWPAPPAAGSTSAGSRTVSSRTRAHEIKAWLEILKDDVDPDVILTHGSGRRAPGPSRGLPADLEPVSRSPDPRIRDPQVGRRSASAERICAAQRCGAGTQDRAPARAFRDPAVQGLVRCRDLRRPGAPPRHGVPRPRTLRRGLRHAQSRAGIGPACPGRRRPTETSKVMPCSGLYRNLGYPGFARRR